MTVTTFYSAAGDGIVYTADKAAWADAQGAADGDGAVEIASADGARSMFQADGNFAISRDYFPIDTSALPDTDVISAAKLQIYVISITDQDNDDQAYLAVIQTTQASTASLAVGDYDAVGTTKGSSNYDITSISTGGYYDYSLNATGIGWIDKTGYTKLGIREGHDLENTAIDSSGGEKKNCASHYYTEEADVTKDPKLEVTHAAAATTGRLPQLSYYYK